MHRERIKIEARYSHDRVIGVVLVSNGKVGDLVPHKGEVIVGGMDRFHEGWTRGEEWHILNVRIVLLSDC